MYATNAMKFTVATWVLVQVEAGGFLFIFRFNILLILLIFIQIKKAKLMTDGNMSEQAYRQASTYN